MNEFGLAQEHVIAEAVIEARLTDPEPLPMLVSLACTSENPGTVSVSFCNGDGEPPVWTFARELLSEALTGPVEDGDIKFWREGADTLVAVQQLQDPLRTQYPGGRIRFEFPAREVRAFLGQADGPVLAATEQAFDITGLDLLFGPE